MNGDQRLLLKLLDEGFDRRAWHGPNLASSIRGLSAVEAAWRPGPERHSIWEIVLHCAYWKSIVRRRLGPETERGFPRRGRDWPELAGVLDERSWRADVKLLKQEHARLRSAVAGLGSKAIGRVPPGQTRTRTENILGIAAHDVYHAGQIRLLRKLFGGGSPALPAVA